MNPIDALKRKCQEQEKRIQQQEIEIADWISVFGHISESPDTAGNMINERMDGMQSRIKELEAKLELQPCGHPNACIVQGEQLAPNVYTCYCGWCQSLDVARWQERARCIEIARSEGEEWGSTARGAEARAIASMIAEQDIREDS